MIKLPWAAVVVLAISASTVSFFAGCGTEVDGDIPLPDGGDDAASPDDPNTPRTDGGSLTDSGAPDPLSCAPNGKSCTTSLDCCSASCIALEGGAQVCGPPIDCTPTGSACTTASECCGLSCKEGLCQKCVADSPTPGDCTTNADCCSQNCSNGKCAPVPVPGGGTPTCRTSGNPCTAAAECCSKVCNGGVCADVSFCTQNGDICSRDFECCGGSCAKAAGSTVGRCATVAGPSGGCEPTGTVCTGGGGDFACDNKCCSRSCGPYGAVSGVKVCQPPSGCLPEYELCRTNADCCGGPGRPQNQTSHPESVTCDRKGTSAEFGRCEKAKDCSPPGAVCKLGSEACGVNNRCCNPDGFASDYCQSNPDRCCAKDALGIPRCLVKPIDCTGMTGDKPEAGDTCATSADCCGMPCVGNKCGGSCVPKGGACTVAADCCSGLPCTVPAGSTTGVCGGDLQPDGGVAPPPDAGGGGGSDGGAGDCALYGQECTANGDCCNAVPCTAGRCRYP